MTETQEQPATTDRGRLPKHMQISELLIREIAAGRLADGARLAPEREMAAGLGISVGTLRRALVVLTEKGLLDRIQGSGNYVKSAAQPTGIYSFFRLERPDGGGLPTAKVLSVDYIARPVTVGTTPARANATRIRRLRSLDGVPAALEEIWIDAPGAQALVGAALSDSLYLTFQKVLSLGIERTEDRVSTAEAPNWATAPFAPAAGAPTGYVARKGWSAGALVEISYTWFDTQVAAFVSRSR